MYLTSQYIDREAAKAAILQAESRLEMRVKNAWARPKFAEAIAKVLDKVNEPVEIHRARYELGAYKRQVKQLKDEKAALQEELDELKRAFSAEVDRRYQMAKALQEREGC